MTHPIDPVKTQCRNNGFVYSPNQKPMDKQGDRNKEAIETAHDPLDNFDKLVKKHKT